jgi:hypothetical protein
MLANEPEAGQLVQRILDANRMQRECNRLKKTGGKSFKSASGVQFANSQGFLSFLRSLKNAVMLNAAKHLYLHF